MTVNTEAIDCRFCSIVSKANGEDPIGTAGYYTHWIILEMVQPWPAGLWVEHPILTPLFQRFSILRQEQGIAIRPLVIAPDRDYSVPKSTRVIYYRRPRKRFAKFEKQEFILPKEPDEDFSQLITPLAIALLEQSQFLSDFDCYRQETESIREILVCTHGNVDVACARFGYPIYEQLKSNYGSNNKSLRVWRCSHFGGHQFAPTLVDLPEGRYWGHLESEILDLLINRHDSPEKLRRFYRGWAGLSQFEQIVDREIWLQQGWDWFDYEKEGQIIAIDENNEEWEADWAEVRINFSSIDGKITGAYQGRVEVSHQIMTMTNSADDQSLTSVKQYHISQLFRV
ncbi:Sucraseferredoxin family protein (plasmid) [Gloeothece citriformis PCC 7424]|uniref:Sucraseferredoxin family protein n=1 Tax=Gloeothece citriformis (strain PCC 7424) TaxID=65393 RepID=B7KM03_GLOC7|nr:sucrase ferredoxin [Gloeothece citriformis]ACK73825.1 Sucraseferredoxin family protein [Gloeothece citriformis PCC 7424]